MIQYFLKDNAQIFLSISVKSCVFQFPHYYDGFPLLIDSILRLMLKLDTMFTNYVLQLPNVKGIYMTFKIPVHILQDCIFPSDHRFSLECHIQQNSH